MNRWLVIKDKAGVVYKIRKDRIVSFILWKEGITIYVHTHIKRTEFTFVLDESGPWSNTVDKETLGNLQSYLSKETEVGGELNLDPE